MFEKMGANEFTIEDIENFLNGESVETPATEGSESSNPSGNTETENAAQGVENKGSKVTETQAFAHRLKEATSKARNEERESIAKSLGYASYAEMQAKREKEMLEEKGLDPDDVSPVVEQIVKKRIAEDPLMKELGAYREERINAWAKQELAELKEFTDGKISRLEDVPKDVLELWKTKGSLKGAYIELHGEKLIREMRAGIASGQTRSTTSHMQSPQGTPGTLSNSDKRPLTQKERDIYKLFNPDVTSEQLSKMYKEN